MTFAAPYVPIIYPGARSQTVQKYRAARRRCRSVTSLDEHIAREMRMDALPPTELHRGLPSCASIIRACAAYWGVSGTEIAGRSLLRRHVLPRQVAMFLMRELAEKYWCEAGRRIGGRDHTTAIYAWQKITRLIAVDDELRASVERVTAKLAGDIGRV